MLDQPDPVGASVGQAVDPLRMPMMMQWSVRLLNGLMGLGAITTVLVIVFSDDLIAAWARNQPADTAIQQPVFTPVAIVLFIVTAGTILVILPFYRGGYGFARITLVAIVACILLATLAGLRTQPPMVFVVISVLSIPLVGAIFYTMLHRDTTAYLRGPSGR